MEVNVKTTDVHGRPIENKHQAEDEARREAADDGAPKFGDLCELCKEPLDQRDVDLMMLRHEGCY